MSQEKRKAKLVIQREVNPKGKPKTRLHRKAGHFSISQRLWYSRQSNSETSKDVHL